VSVVGEPWGELEGRPVELFTLSSGAGMSVSIASYGGVVQSIRVPDSAGRTVNVALGLSSLDEYVSNFSGASGSASGATYFGAVVGRYANRIAGRAFVLDGRRVELAGNTGPDDAVTLHGGPGGGYSGRVWEASVVDAGAGPGSAVRLSYVDPDGFNGFPGTVVNEVVYAVTPDNALRISYRATADAPTVIGLTNHTYFNLAGEGSGPVDDQWLAIRADVVQPADSVGIPVGFAPVEGTPFDFRAFKPIGRDLRAFDAPLGAQLSEAGGYDHNLVLRGSGYRLAAVAWDPGSGIALWTYTDQPGVQLYTANHLAGDLVGTGGRPYRRGDAFALETQRFPDGPNHIGEPGWPAVVLRPGEEWRSRTTYKFGVAGGGLAERIRF
jgi:aldose 1-epimerase